MRTDKMSYYFKLEKWTLLLVTLSGILYNVGMVAVPWFEGQLVQRLFDIMNGKKQFADMVFLALLYTIVILLVQGSRFVKRLYVRKFANHINKEMKQILYENIVRRKQTELEQDGIGNVMTKAILDVDTCVEGMRKFTTEIFDTGIVMIAYLVMLLFYDWRLTLLSMIFPPIAYLIAEKLKVLVSKSASDYKKSAGQLNTATLDRIANAMTYRVYGQEFHINQLYENALTHYEKSAVFANIWETSMQPIYQIISSLSVIFILWFGSKNILGQGFCVWNIAAFTTFLSCFMKLAVKSSKAAKLFNAVQKANVSWERIKPYLSQSFSQKQSTASPTPMSKLELRVQHLSFHYGDNTPAVLSDLSFRARTGEIIGIAGPVACGKSTLGKVFLCEHPYEGHITLNGEELTDWNARRRVGNIAYMGHHPELLSASIEDNILLGSQGDVLPVLKAVCMDNEVLRMPDGIHTQIGNGGVRLSGGQQARIALARTLYHKKEIIILDDPFSAVDQTTEATIMKNSKQFLAESITLIISHRLSLFPDFDQVLWLDKPYRMGSHEELCQQNASYAQVYTLQTGGTPHEAETK